MFELHLCTAVYVLMYGFPSSILVPPQVSVTVLSRYSFKVLQQYLLLKRLRAYHYKPYKINRLNDAFLMTIFLLYFRYIQVLCFQCKRCDLSILKYGFCCPHSLLRRHEKQGVMLQTG